MRKEESGLEKALRYSALRLLWGVKHGVFKLGAMCCSALGLSQRGWQERVPPEFFSVPHHHLPSILPEAVGERSRRQVWLQGDKVTLLKTWRDGAPSLGRDVGPGKGFGFRLQQYLS